MGGWTTREVKRIIRGLAGLKFMYVNFFPRNSENFTLISIMNVPPSSALPSGADVVEVAPAYDHADITSIAAADIIHDFLSLFVSAKPPPQPRPPRGERQLPRKDEL